jgi:carbohydrate-selective porin OprB
MIVPNMLFLKVKSHCDLSKDAGSVGVGAEMALEITYQAKTTKCLSTQPDLQIMINPAGNQDLIMPSLSAAASRSFSKIYAYP